MINRKTIVTLLLATSASACAANDESGTAPASDASADVAETAAETSAETLADTTPEAAPAVDAATCPKSGATETRKCGGCGSQNRFCLPDRQWTDWTSCVGEMPDAECKLGEKRTDVCGNCGTKTDFCDETKCVWVEGACVKEGECAPDTVETTSASCGPGEIRTRTCKGTCEWSPFSSCALPKGWIPTATTSLVGRFWHSAVWAADRMIVWGGYGTSGYLSNGASFEPLTNKWTGIAASTLSARRNHLAVWTGSRMIVWGGQDSSPKSDGAVYEPAKDTWTAMATSPLSARFLPANVWSTTTNELIVWGGCTSGLCSAVASDGATYDPATDKWTPMSPTPTGFAGRYDMAYGWSGTELVIYGGRGPSTTTFYTDGVRYDPKTKVWTKFSSPPTTSLDGRYDASFAFGDGSLVVWGGRSSTSLTTAKNNGAIYTPMVGWAAITPPTDTLFAPSAKRWAAASWFGGGKLYVFSGSGTSSTTPIDGFAAYDVAKDSWAAIDAPDAPSARDRATAVWTGREGIVWGGVKSDTCCTYQNDGAVYRP